MKIKSSLDLPYVRKPPSDVEVGLRHFWQRWRERSQDVHVISVYLLLGNNTLPLAPSEDAIFSSE